MESKYLIERREKMLGKKPEEKKYLKPLKFHSKKRAADQREYVKLVDAMLTFNPYCEIRSEGCTKNATGMHHMKKRSPALLLDKRYLKRACDNCQAWCEKFPLEAISKGYSLSKYNRA